MSPLERGVGTECLHWRGVWGQNVSTGEGCGDRMSPLERGVGKRPPVAGSVPTSCAECDAVFYAPSAYECVGCAAPCDECVACVGLLRQVMQT